MRVKKELAGLIVLLLLLVQPALAADSANGKILHDEQCLRCHDSALYTRDERRVQSFEALSYQVDVCISQLGVAWFDEEKADVIEYLNDNFYTFP